MRRRAILAMLSPPLARTNLDRKSTRLNSSHRCISYAVFCLKKKIGRDAPWGRTVAVGVLMMAAYLAVLAAMAMAPVSYVVAAREVSIVVTAVLGVLVLRERHSATRIAGAAVIFAGLVVIALAR